MGYDEAMTYMRFASRSIVHVVSDYAAPNNHVFHTLCVHVSVLVFGDAPWAIRMPALVAGVCIVPMVFFAGRTLFAVPVALAASLVSAVWPVLVYFSVDARGYTFLTLFFLISILLTPHLLRARGYFSWSLQVVVFSIGIWTVPVFLYVIAVVCGLAFQRLARERNLQGLWRVLSCALAGMVLGLALYSPILVKPGGVHRFARNKYVSPNSLPEVAQRLPVSVLKTWNDWNESVPAGVAACVAAPFGIAIAVAALRKGLPVFLSAVVACVIVTTWLRVVPYSRVWLFLVPLYLLTASSGVFWLAGTGGERWRSVMPVVWLAAIVAGVAWNGYRRTWPPIPARQLALYFRAISDGNDLIFGKLPVDVPLQYYLARCPARDDEEAAGRNTAGDVRVFVVTDDALGQTCEAVLAASPGDGIIRPSEMAYLKRVGRTSVYMGVLPASNSRGNPAVMGRKSS
jgi:hypothetical protein